MNIATNKLIAKDVIREINDFDYFHWTAEQCQERIQVMQKALNIINQILEDISSMDLNARLYYSSEKRQVEHYLQICIDQLPVEEMEEKFVPDDFGPFVTGSNPTISVLSVAKSSVLSRLPVWFKIYSFIMLLALSVFLFIVL